MYCGEAEEGPLLQYLATARDPLGRPLYDAQYALRLVRQRDRIHASVALFCELSMYEVHPPCLRYRVCFCVGPRLEVREQSFGASKQSLY